MHPLTVELKQNAVCFLNCDDVSVRHNDSGTFQPFTQYIEKGCLQVDQIYHTLDYQLEFLNLVDPPELSIAIKSLLPDHLKNYCYKDVLQEDFQKDQSCLRQWSLEIDTSLSEVITRERSIKGSYATLLLYPP